MNPYESIQATLLSVLAVPGCTGDEDAIAKAIEALVKPYVDDITRDAMGNLICTKRGNGPRIMLAGHMDQIGVVAHDIDDKGFVRVTPVGGLAPNTLYSKRILFGNGVQGVLMRETDHPDDAWTFPRCYVDIGAATREEAQALVPCGTFGIVPHDATLLANHRIAAPAMDDRAGCAVIIEALKAMKNVPATVIAVFTTQEEVGLRGSTAAAWSQQPDMGIALDVTTVGDTPKCPRNACKLGGGAAIKMLDGGMVPTPALRNHMIAMAEKRGIPYQREVLPGGTTDARAMQTAHAGIPSGCISIPTRYVHSMVETIDLADMKACIDLLVAMLEEPMKA